MIQTRLTLQKLRGKDGGNNTGIVIALNFASDHENKHAIVIRRT